MPPSFYLHHLIPLYKYISPFLIYLSHHSISSSISHGSIYSSISDHSMSTCISPHQFPSLYLRPVTPSSPSLTRLRISTSMESPTRRSSRRAQRRAHRPSRNTPLPVPTPTPPPTPPHLPRRRRPMGAERRAAKVARGLLLSRVRLGGGLCGALWDWRRDYQGEYPIALHPDSTAPPIHVTLPYH